MPPQAAQGSSNSSALPVRAVLEADSEASGAEVGTVANGARSWLPLIFIAISSVGFSLQTLFARELTLSGVVTFQVIIIRGACQAAGCMAVLRCAGRSWRGWFGESRNEFLTLCGRGLIGYGGIAFGFAGVSLLPLAESQVLGQTAPMFAAAYAFVLLGEAWYCTEFASAALGLVGVLFIARPAALFGHTTAVAGVADESLSLRITGITCSLLGATCAGAAYVFVRMLGTRIKAHWAVVLLAQANGQVLLGLPSVAMAQPRHWLLTPRQWALAVAGGFVGFVSQAFMTYGMQREKSATAAVVRQGFMPLFAFVWQVLFLPGDPIFLTTIAGYAVIFVGLVTVVLGKIQRESHAVAAAVGDGYAKL